MFVLWHSCVEETGVTKLSIIMAVYNARRTLGASLDSLLVQTYCDFEVICVDDGSSDGSLDVLRDYARRDCRIRIVANPHGGATVALNTGLAAATGDVIGFLDNDDAHHPQAFEFAMRVLDSQQVDVVVWDWKGIPDGVFEDSAFDAVDATVPAAALQDKLDWGMGDHHVSFWCKLYRRKIIEHVRFDPSIIHGDVVFYWSLWVNPTIRVAYLPVTLTHYREREGSVMHSAMTLEKAVDRARVVRCIFQNTREWPQTRRMLQRRFFPERIWSIYKITRREPELACGVLCELRRLFKEKVVRFTDFPLIRMVKVCMALYRPWFMGNKERDLK